MSLVLLLIIALLPDEVPSLILLIIVVSRFHLVIHLTSFFCGDDTHPPPPPLPSGLAFNVQVVGGCNNLCTLKRWDFFPFGLFVGFLFFFSCMILLLFTKVSSYVLFRFWILGMLGLLNFCWDMFADDHLLQITFWFEMNGSHFDLHYLSPYL